MLRYQTARGPAGELGFTRALLFIVPFLIQLLPSACGGQSLDGHGRLHGERLEQQALPSASPAPKKTVTLSQYHLVTYDSQGRLEKEVYEHCDDGYDGRINRRTTISFAYDGHGRLVRRTAEHENTLASCRYRRETAHLEYNEEGHLIRETVHIYTGVGTVANARIVSSFLYSENRMIAKSSEFDDDADGSVDRREKAVYTYSDQGDLIGELIEKETSRDGTAEERVAQMLFYDGGKKLVRKVLEYSGPQGRVKRREMIALSNSEGGKDTTEVKSIDGDADGVVDEIQTMVTHHLSDSDGRPSGQAWLILLHVVTLLVVLVAVVLHKWRIASNMPKTTPGTT